MSNETKNTRPTRPDINKTKRYDDVDIEFNKDAELEEGTTYEGSIKECYVVESDKGKSFQLIITLDDDDSDFESFHAIPLHKYSPLKAFMAEMENELGRKPRPKDLNGLRVEFSVRYNEKDGKDYCNLNSIDFIYEDQEDDD